MVNARFDLSVFRAQQARNILLDRRCTGCTAVVIATEDLGILKCDFDVKPSNPPGHVAAYIHWRPTVGSGRGTGGDAAVIVTLISPGDPSTAINGGRGAMYT